MKQTIAVLAVTLAVLLAVSGLIVSANLRQAEMIAEKATQQTELLGKLNKLTAEARQREEEAQATAERLRAVTEERDALSNEMDDTARTIRAANGAILHLREAGEQTEAAHARETGDLAARLEAALLQVDALTGERNGAVLRNQELAHQARSHASAIRALQEEIASFGNVLALLDGAARTGPGPRAAAHSLVKAAAAFAGTYPHSVLRLPAALLDALAAEAGDVRQGPALLYAK